VECDGEIYHRDEHGNLRVEDVERQAVLERAGGLFFELPTATGEPTGTPRSNA